MARSDSSASASLTRSSSFSARRVDSSDWENSFITSGFCFLFRPGHRYPQTMEDDSDPGHIADKPPHRQRVLFHQGRRADDLLAHGDLRMLAEIHHLQLI